DPCRPVEPLDVVGEAEHRRPALGLVRADALEYPGAVMECVREDVDLGLVPRHEGAVHPDELPRGDGHHNLLYLARPDMGPNLGGPPYGQDDCSPSGTPRRSSSERKPGPSGPQIDEARLAGLGRLGEAADGV